MKTSRLISIVLILVLSACTTQNSGNPSKVSSASKSSDPFFAIHTDDPAVKQLFQRGVVLTYGFNHQEAHNVYMRAAAQDSNCAMCYWGASLVLGPNINKPMDPKDAPTAHNLAQKALEHSSDANPLQQSLIKALTNVTVRTLRRIDLPSTRPMPMRCAG